MTLCILHIYGRLRRQKVSQCFVWCQSKPLLTVDGNWRYQITGTTAAKIVWKGVSWLERMSECHLIAASNGRFSYRRTHHGAVGLAFGRVHLQNRSPSSLATQPHWSQLSRGSHLEWKCMVDPFPYQNQKFNDLHQWDRIGGHPMSAQQALPT